MNSTQALQSDIHDVRLSHEDKWMVWDHENVGWIVYQHPRYARHTKILIETVSERDAVAVLLGDPGNS